MGAETPWRSLALIRDKKGSQKGPHKTGKQAELHVYRIEGSFDRGGTFPLRTVGEQGDG